MANMTNTPDVSYYKASFQEWLGAKRDENKEAREAWRYYHGNQWTDEEKKALRERKQPIVTANRIKRKIDALVGLDSRYRQDPKAYGRTEQHNAEASIATAAIRFVMDNNDWASLSDECILDACVQGVMVLEMNFGEDADYDEPTIELRRVSPDRFFYDPRSQEYDLSDARYLGTWAWMDLEDAAAMFPEKAEELKEAAHNAQMIDGLEENEKDGRFKWFNPKRKLVRVVEMWKRRGEAWEYCFFTGSSILANGPSEFMNALGKPGHRYEIASAYIDEEGDRYGLVRDMRSPQDEINHRRSKLLHQLSVRQTWGRSGAVKDVNATRLQMARPDGHLEMEGEFGTDWGIINQNDQIAGQAQLLQESKDEIENFGPNQALIGQGGVSDSSGRAIALLQAAGMAELALFFGRIRSWKLRVYRRVWHNVRRVWTAERMIRVTDSPESPQFLTINQLQVDEFGRPVMQAALSQMSVDIIIDESPDTVTLQSETFGKLVQLVQAGIQIPPDALLEAADLDHSVKQRLMERMQQAAQAEAQDSMRQAAMQLEVAEKEADIGLTVAKTQSEQVKAQRDLFAASGLIG